MPPDTPPTSQQTLTLQEAIDVAVQHHTAGELTQAESVYHQILETHPDQPEALHLLGVIAHQKGENERAVDMIEKTLTHRPRFAEAYSNLGVALVELGRFEEAEFSYRKAIEIKPDYVEAHDNLAIALRKLGQLEEAVTCYKRVVEIKPNFTEAHINLGNILQELGGINEAIGHYRRVCDIYPNHGAALNNSGIILNEMGCLDEAWASFKNTLKTSPDDAEAFSNIQLVLYPLCYEASTKQREASAIEKVLDDLPTPPEPDILRLRFAELTGGNLKKAWESVADNMPTIASETIANETKSRGPSSKNSELSFDKKMVALLHFGRSGTGYFHSLLDSHPAISTLPGVYMNGYFGRGVWSRLVGKGFKGISEQFSSLYKVLFDARFPDKVPPAFVSDTHANKSVGVREGFTAMGANRDTPLTLDRGQFVDTLDTMSVSYTHLTLPTILLV